MDSINIGDSLPKISASQLPDDGVFDSIQLTGGTGTQGRLTWNTEEETVDLVTNGTVLQLGEELTYPTQNNSGVDILDGTPVGATGTLGASGKITIAKWDPSTMEAKYFLGFATEDIPNGEPGKVTFFGKVRNITTDGSNYGETWNDGDVIYPSGTTTAYATNVEPAPPYVSMATAIVIKAHATSGTLYVRVNNFDRNHPAHQFVTSAVLNSSYGVKHGLTSPAYGWRDMIGYIRPSDSGASKPTAASLNGGPVQYYFSTGDKIDNINMHLAHDFLSGAAELFAHTHFTHDGTAISGTLQITWKFQYASGYNRGTFGTPITIVQNIACSIENHPQYAHSIEEFVCGTDTGSGGTVLNTSNMETDGLLAIEIEVTGTPTITGGTINKPFILFADIHYECTGLNTTPNRNYPFYD